MITDVQRIEIIENFNGSIQGWDTIADIDFHVIDNLDSDGGFTDDEFIFSLAPEELYERNDLDLDDVILEIIDPVLVIWDNNLKEVFAKYEDLKVTEYVDKFTFDTKENIKKWYDEISEDVERDPEEEDEEDKDDEDSASWNIYNQFIAAQVKHDFSKKVKDYILELKTPEVLKQEEELKVKEEAEMKAELEAEIEDLLAKYKEAKKKLIKLQKKQIVNLDWC